MIENTMAPSRDDLLKKVAELQAENERLTMWAGERFDELHHEIADQNKIIAEFRKGNRPTVADYYMSDESEAGSSTVRDLFKNDELDDQEIYRIYRMADLEPSWAIKIGDDIHEFEDEQDARNFLLNVDASAQ